LHIQPPFKVSPTCTDTDPCTGTAGAGLPRLPPSQPWRPSVLIDPPTALHTVTGHGTIARRPDSSARPERRCVRPAIPVSGSLSVRMLLTVNGDHTCNVSTPLGIDGVPGRTHPYEQWGRGAFAGMIS
jgi:hypothetical protein